MWSELSCSPAQALNWNHNGHQLWGPRPHSHWGAALLTQDCSNLGSDCRWVICPLIHSHSPSKYLCSIICALGIVLSTSIHGKGNSWVLPSRCSSIAQEQNRQQCRTVGYLIRQRKDRVQGPHITPQLPQLRVFTSLLQFLRNGSSFPQEESWGLNELIHIKHLEQYLEVSKSLVSGSYILAVM